MSADAARATAATPAYLRPAATDRLSPGGELSLGQIVKARVLRHYDEGGGGRYLVSLEGRERVVDSSVPLKTGEIIRGRVVALGDRVELQPLPEENAAAAPAAAAPKPDASVTSPTDELTAAFANAGLKLDDEARSVLTRALRGAEDPQALLLAALTLAKIGLPLDPALMNAIQTLLRKHPAAEPLAEPAEAFALSSGPTLPAQLREAVKTALARSETASSVETPATPADLSGAGAQDRQAPGDGGSGDGSGQLGQWVLNAQTGGSVLHRVGTLPLIIGGRLIEVDVALFEQDARRAKQGEARSRHLVFVLNTEGFGGVEVSARLVNSHVRVRFKSDRNATLDLLAGRQNELRRQLTQLGWVVDEIAYEPKAGDEGNPAYRAVVDHVISQGSLDRSV
jgi:plasmid stability protein